MNTAPHLGIRTPDLYTNWVQNDPLQILWNSFGNVTATPVQIDLYQDGPNGPQFLTTITSSTPDTGEYTWTASTSGINFGTYNLRIQISLVGDPAVFDRSTETFTVPENTTTFYVNDSSTVGDQYTTAPGSNRNDGRLPSRCHTSTTFFAITHWARATRSTWTPAITHRLHPSCCRRSSASAMTGASR